MAFKVLLVTAVAFAVVLLRCAIASESPQYAVVYSGTDFEIRNYENMTWMSGLSSELSFELATVEGFHRLFEYSIGANLNNTRVLLGTPIVTSIALGAGPLHSSAYLVSMYPSSEFQASPPIPMPDLNLQVTTWPSHCVAVREFPGFAQDGNVVDEADKLADSLSKSPWANSTYPISKYAYSIAQYDLPFQFFDRRNEVWVDVNCTKPLASGLSLVIA